MKNKMPSEGLRLGREIGSILCDTLKKVAFSDGLGGGGEVCHSANIELNMRRLLLTCGSQTPFPPLGDSP